jgi:ABC-type multidrug transport system fused ATPase/permease subunit
MIPKTPGGYHRFVHCSIFFISTLENTNGQIPSNSGALGAKLSIDALNVRRLVGDNLALLAQVISGLITGLVIAFVADWKLTLIILCAMPLSGAQGYAQVKFLKGFSQDAKVIYVKNRPSGCYHHYTKYGITIEIKVCIYVVILGLQIT